jgi:hypothetical protein
MILLASIGLFLHLTNIPPPADVLHYQSIMRKISLPEEKERLISYVENDTTKPSPFIKTIYGEKYTTFGTILTYLHAKMNYTREDIIRHEDPIEILEYGLGRCGEFSIAYTALCIAVDLNARLVMCLSDHVWCEIGYTIWSVDESAIKIEWLHYDPTGKVVDDPYMYERDWGKNFDGTTDKVYAIEPDAITDVTDKYCYLPNVYIDMVEEYNLTLIDGEIEERKFWLNFDDFAYFIAFALSQEQDVVYMVELADDWVFWYPYDGVIQCRYYLEKEL